MARSDPDKLAQALRANLRRRKSAVAAPAPEKAEKAPENLAEKAPPPQG
jgi:hypothetical protein